MVDMFCGATETCHGNNRLAAILSQMTNKSRTYSAADGNNCVSSINGASMRDDPFMGAALVSMVRKIEYMETRRTIAKVWAFILGVVQFNMNAGHRVLGTGCNDTLIDVVVSRVFASASKDDVIAACCGCLTKLLCCVNE